MLDHKIGDVYLCPSSFSASYWLLEIVEVWSDTLKCVYVVVPAQFGTLVGTFQVLKLPLHKAFTLVWKAL